MQLRTQNRVQQQCSFNTWYVTNEATMSVDPCIAALPQVMAHDAMTGYEKNPFEGDVISIDDALENQYLVETLVRQFSMTQQGGFTDQINAGVRSFDLRLYNVTDQESDSSFDLCGNYQHGSEKTYYEEFCHSPYKTREKCMEAFPEFRDQIECAIPTCKQSMERCEFIGRHGDGEVSHLNKGAYLREVVDDIAEFIKQDRDEGEFEYVTLWLSACAHIDHDNKDGKDERFDTKCATDFIRQMKKLMDNKEINFKSYGFEEIDGGTCDDYSALRMSQLRSASTGSGGLIVLSKNCIIDDDYVKSHYCFRKKSDDKLFDLADSCEEGKSREYRFRKYNSTFRKELIDDHVIPAFQHNDDEGPSLWQAHFQVDEEAITEYAILQVVRNLGGLIAGFINMPSIQLEQNRRGNVNQEIIKVLESGQESGSLGFNHRSIQLDDVTNVGEGQTDSDGNRVKAILDQWIKDCTDPTTDEAKCK